MNEVSYGNHKRTWQGVPGVFLHYLYNRYIVHASNNLKSMYQPWVYSLYCLKEKIK